MNIDRKSACCFTGHRVIPTGKAEELRRRVKDGILYLCENMNITTYYAGGALGFDTLAAEAVIEYRKERPNIRLVIVMPCRDQSARWNMADKLRYERIKNAANEVICLSEQYHRDCMLERNRYLIDHSRVCICYLTKQTGGTAYTVKYARENGLRIFNIAREKGASAQ